MPKQGKNGIIKKYPNINTCPQYWGKGEIFWGKEEKMKVKELWKRLIISHKVPKLPQGYVYQNRIFGFEIAGNHVGQICWIRGGKTLSGKEVPGFWKELDSSDVIDMNGKSRKMTLEEFERYQAVLNE